MQVKFKTSVKSTTCSAITLNLFWFYLQCSEQIVTKKPCFKRHNALIYSYFFLNYICHQAYARLGQKVTIKL